MSEYVTTIGNRTLAFTDDHLKIDSFVIPYGEMSKIGFRSGEKPGFVFQYSGQQMMIPCVPGEKEKMYPYFQKAAALEKRRNEKEEASVIEPISADRGTEQTEPKEPEVIPPETAKKTVTGKGPSKTTVCKHCGAEIAKSAKKCPHCGGKNKKPIYKRVWFIILCILVALGIIGAIAGGGDDTSTTPSNNEKAAATQEQPVEYTAYDVKDLNADLEKNAINAKEKYADQHIALKGKLENIDSDGAFITLTDPNDEWGLVGVSCYIKDPSQLEIVKKHSTGDIITVKGKVTDVGELLGYSIDIESIE